MPLRLDIKRKLSARSDRVKCVDIHPTEPWVLSTLYNGNVYIWNYVSQALVKSFEVTELPVRAGRFIARKQWLVTGADDMHIRVFNYNTYEKVKAFEAHSDYIRSIAVHPSSPFVLTSSDDMLIKLWDWEKGWQNTQVFEGHSHYVMMVVFNPKDSNTFATASLDRTIKVWSVGSATPNFTLEGHEKGVNCVDYFQGGDKPYLITGSDDRSLKIWDYQNKSCVQTFDGHTHNVSCVMFHPELPVILSGSEDGTIRVWHSTTYRLENTLNYGLERVWTIALLKGSNKVAIGYDEGTILIKLGREEPSVSMDTSGKIIWARHNEVSTVNIKAASKQDDGEVLPLAPKELGSCEVYPQSLKHSSNGRFVVVCGDGEYTIYTALAWRNKSYGSALEFVWSQDSGEYAVRESASKIKTFKNFKEKNSFRPAFSAEEIFGGCLLAVRSSSFVCLYDWEECRMIRRIDVVPKAIYWADNAEYCTIACEGVFYILRYNGELVSAALETGGQIPDDGIDDAFEVLHEVSERVLNATWVGDCFIYTNAGGRLNYCVGGEVQTIAHLDRRMYLLGYLPATGRLYLIDKEYQLVSFSLMLSVIEYQTAVVREDMEAAAAILPSIPEDQKPKVARFLEAQGHVEEALKVTTDPEHKFDLAIQLGQLQVAFDIGKEADSEPKWKQLGDLAIQAGKFQMAQESLKAAKDLGGLVLLYSATSNRKGLQELVQVAKDESNNNVAFLALFLLGDLDGCLKLLVETGRVPEAAFMSRTYLPSRVSEMVSLWRKDLEETNKKVAESLADPMEYENLFPDLAVALQAEKLLASKRGAVYPASEYLSRRDELNRDVIGEIKAGDAADDDNVEEEEEEQVEEATPEEEEEEEVAEEAEAEAAPEEDTEQPAPQEEEEEAVEEPADEDVFEEATEDVAAPAQDEDDGLDLDGEPSGDAAQIDDDEFEAMLESDD